MTLIEDAGKVWHRLWSVRLSLLAAALGAADAAMPFIAPEHASPRFAAAAAAVSVGAALSRLVAQPRMKGRHHG